MTALDVGCGMGYFTLPLARLVQPEGTVIAADLQPEMLNGLRRRAARAGLLDSICFLNCTPDRIGLDKSLDFALAFWMVHEVRHPEPFMQEIFTALKPGGRLLVVEPVVHVPREAFELTISLAKQLGFTFEGRPEVRLSRAALFRKQ
jgi:ubiquinone/menaquinone biosynthesis C-methylase UbiE